MAKTYRQISQVFTCFIFTTFYEDDDDEDEDEETDGSDVVDEVDF